MYGLYVYTYVDFSIFIMYHSISYQCMYVYICIFALLRSAPELKKSKCAAAPPAM